MRRLAGLTVVMALGFGASLGCGGDEGEKPPPRPTVGSLAGVQSRLEAAGYEAGPNLDDIEAFSNADDIERSERKSVEAVGGLYISKAGEDWDVRVKRYASAKDAATVAGDFPEKPKVKVFGPTLVYWDTDGKSKVPAVDLRRIMAILRAA